MKYALLLVCLAIGMAPVAAQTLSFDQAVVCGTTTTHQSDRSDPRKVVLDNQGNRYVTGTFSGTVRFGNITLIGPTGYDAFVAKFDPAGNVLWAVRGGGNGGDDAGTALAFDPLSNTVVVAGRFAGATATFGSNTFTKRGGTTGNDVWLGRLSATGTWLWSGHVGSTTTDFAYDLAVDGAGNVLLAGVYGQTVMFGTLTATLGSISSFAVAKLSPSNTWLWAVGGSSSYGTQPDVAVVTDTAGNVYWGGSFGGTATFGTSTLTSAGEQDWFLQKLDPAGQPQWAIRAGGPGADQVRRLRFDAGGNLYVLGSFEDTAAFGTTSLTSVGGEDVAVARLTQAGVFQWAARGGSVGRDTYQDLAVDANGTSYITGNGFDTGTGITFGSTTLRIPPNSSGSHAELVVARLDAQGNWAGAISGGGLVTDSGNSIVVDNQGRAHVAGTFTGNATFGSVQLAAASSVYPTGVLARVSGTPLAARFPRPTGLALFPNPARTALTLHLSGDAPRTGLQVTLLDATGRAVRTQPLANTGAGVRVELGQQPAGLYLVRVEGPNGYLATQRLVVE